MGEVVGRVRGVGERLLREVGGEEGGKEGLFEEVDLEKVLDEEERITGKRGITGAMLNKLLNLDHEQHNK